LKMSKKSKPKKPPVKKVVERPTSKEVITMLKKIVPEKTEVKPTVEPLKPPVKPAKTSTQKPHVQVNKVIKTKLRKKVVDLPPEHEKYFVYLKNPLEYRRHLLESSRKILFCLKNYQRLLLLRQKKLEEMQKLKASLKELIYMNKKFNEKLPKYNTMFLESMQTEDKNINPDTKAVRQRRPVEIPQEKTEIDKLEESLAKIEQKLKSLK
jgi:hypothetical protein